MKIYRTIGDRTGRGGNLLNTDTDPKLIKTRNPMKHLIAKKKKRK
jgi:hypothetical protein